MRLDRQDFAATSPVLAIFASAIAAFLWAFILALPGTSIDGFAFHFMAEVGGDLLWSGVFFTVSMAQLWRLLGRLKHEPLRFALIVDLIVGYSAAALWTFVSLLCVISTYPPSPYVGSTVVLAAGMWWECWSCTPDSYERVPEITQVATSTTIKRKAVG